MSPSPPRRPPPCARSVARAVARAVAPALTPPVALLGALLGTLLGASPGCDATARHDTCHAPSVVAARPEVVALHSGETQQGRFTYRWTSEPDPVPFNERFALIVSVARADQPDRNLPDVTLEANALMPEHGHGMNTMPATTRLPDGRFRVEGMLFHMPGLWQIVFIIRDGGTYDSVLVPVRLE
jgi:hypothetical protein